MSYSKYLKEINGKLNYIDLISYFLLNFSKIKEVNDLDLDIRSKIVNITETPEMILMRLIEENYPGHTSHSFIFKEDDTFNGIFDLDFIYDKLANVRIQLFAEGFFLRQR